MNTAADNIVKTITERNIVNVAEGVRNNNMANSILAGVNRIDRLTKRLNTVAEDTNVITSFDSLGEVLPLYTVTCIE